MLFEIRHGKKSDLSSIISLLNNNLSNYTPADLDLSYAFFERDNTKCFVATANSQIVGFASLHFQINIRGGRVGYIEDVVTMQSYRRQGIATMLLSKITEHAKQNSCYKLIAICEHSLQKFYARNNFHLKRSSMIKVLQ